MTNHTKFQKLYSTFKHDLSQIHMVKDEISKFIKNYQEILGNSAPVCLLTNNKAAR